MGKRIIVDLLGFTGARGGTETYAREILPRLPGALPGVELIALTGRAGADRVRAFFPGRVEVLRAVGADRVSWAAGEVLLADARARRMHADLLWTPSNFGPIRRGVARVATIHDVIYDEVKGSLPGRAVRATTAWLMRRSALTADGVITISETAAAAISRQFGLPRRSLHVVPNGSSAPHPSDSRSLDVLGLDPARPLVLSSGNRMPHKNFEGLLRALAAIPREHRPQAVITGGRGGDPLTPVVSSLGLGDDVVLPGWVTPSQLEALYARATVYACPSTAEGFGLPIVDALRRGCRVVANDIPVLREIGGDAVVYADATEPGAFARALTEALSAPLTEAERTAGREWAERFTWEAAAEGTAAVLQAALSAHDPQQPGGRA